MGQQIKWRNLDKVYILKILKKQSEIQSICEHQIIKSSEQNSCSVTFSRDISERIIIAT